MAKKKNLWEADTLAKRYGIRPSELYGVEDDHSAFVFDRAVADFASYVEDELNKIQGKNQKNRREQRLAVLTADPEKRKFADPMNLVNKKA